MNKVTAGLVCVSLTVVVIVAESRQVTFDDDAVGQLPKGFVFGHTQKEGKPGRWVVQQDADGKFLAQLDSDATRNRFPIAVLSDVSASDVDLSVRFRPMSGRVD